MSVLDREVSQFNGANDTNPETINLLDWLDTDYSREVLRLRGLDLERYKVEKKKLPAITPSGTFRKRKESELIQHSWLIQFDIDNLSDPETLKEALKQVPFIAYCALTPSGRGLWGLIPISDPIQHKAHFRAIKQAFQDMGVEIDSAPQNVASLRFASYDPNPFINHEARVFPYKQDKESGTSTNLSEHTEFDKVQTCIQQIEQYSIDITGDYPTWFQIGSAILETFGEQSRDWFHRISQFSPKYSPEELNQHWDQWTQAGVSANIGVFYNACKDHGILFKTFSQKEAAPYGLNPWTGEIFDERGYPADWDDV